jgi:hypothetical protein
LVATEELKEVNYVQLAIALDEIVCGEFGQPPLVEFLDVRKGCPGPPNYLPGRCSQV